MLAELLAPQRLLDTLARALSRVLATEPATREQLQRLEGCTLDVRVSKLGWRLCVAFEDGGVVLATRSARQADVIIEGSLSDLLAMGRARQLGEAIPAGKVRLEGDLATVQLVQSVLESLALDWEAFLARYLGDLPARQVARVLSGLLALFQRTSGALARDVGEYLRTEAALVPAAGEIEAFAAEVMRLASDVERLAARVQRLERRGSRA